MRVRRAILLWAVCRSVSPIRVIYFVQQVHTRPSRCMNYLFAAETFRVTFRECCPSNVHQHDVRRFPKSKYAHYRDCRERLLENENINQQRRRYGTTSRDPYKSILVLTNTRNTVLRRTNRLERFYT